jgi:hypothetical protein
MIIKIEKDTRFNGHALKAEIKYYLWIDSSIVYSSESEDAIYKQLDVIKKNYVERKTEVIHEEEFNVG